MTSRITTSTLLSLNVQSVVKFGELGERSRMKFDNTLVDPYILDITTKKEYKVNRSIINWDAVKQEFTKKFPQYSTANLIVNR